jgi:hypothetical protein
MFMNERLLREFWESQDAGGTFPYARLTYGQKLLLVHTQAYISFLKRRRRIDRLRRPGNFGAWLAERFDLSN